MNPNQLSTYLPSDPHILASLVNMKLRDLYPQGLDALCEDMGIDRDDLVETLEKGGYRYNPEVNQFR